MEPEDKNLWDSLDTNAGVEETKPVTKDKKQGLAIVGGILSVSVLLAGGYAILDATNSDSKDAKKEVTSKYSDSDKVANEASSELLADPPLIQKTWQKKKWKEQTEKSISNEQKEYAKAQLETVTRRTNVNQVLGGPEMGLTSDLDKVRKKDGTLNPFYSFWTSDLFNEQSTLEVEALINPTFGGWGAAQRPRSGAKTLTPQDFGNIWSDDYLQRFAASKGKMRLPVLLDWKNNGYDGAGVVQQKGGAYWQGRVIDSSASWKYDRKILNYRVSATYKVEFVGVNSASVPVKKRGKLDVQFVPAEMQAAQNGNFRVLINNATLTIS